MGEPVALVALALDAAIGWPAGLYRLVGHPVGAFAAIIERCEAGLNMPAWSFARRRLAGAATVVVLIGVVGVATLAIEWSLLHVFGQWAWLGTAVLAFPGLAQRSLFDHVRAVHFALSHQDIAQARSAVGMIVGRDVASLDEGGVSRAAIESLAESFCDGVAAPLFWLFALGLPGIWVYKAINTADSLIGHREARWRAFGWAAARLDDLLNLVPARLAGTVICVIGGGWNVMWRDAGKHESPNAGWPEAAMAGALHVRLAGPIAYDDVFADKPWIGEGGDEATVRDLGRSLTIYLRACLALWLIAGTVAWAL
ncbi:MAG: adenosylcobinamide-phosphate synthase CbiB [Novosphingobium sp.]